MQFDLRKFIATGRQPYHAEFQCDLSAHDYAGARIPKPVTAVFDAETDGEEIRMTLRANASVHGECARCLDPVVREETVDTEWTVKDSAKDSVVYEKESEALSLVAQWRFKNTFIPEYQEKVTDSFTQGETGGTIELKNTDSKNYTADQNGTKSYFAGVEEQVVATAKANQFYTFIGWYDSKGNVVTTNPELIVNQIKGEIGEYHARFQKTGVAVNFYYLEYNENTKSYEYKVYDGGKYTQYLNKYDSAKKPTDDSKKVKTWYTSPTNLGADTAFDFNQTLSKSIDLYAAPAFTFNYLNQFQFAEPWRMITYATLKYDGKYIDMKTDPDVTDYKVYILKASSVDEKQPTSAEIKANPNPNKVVVSKDDSDIMFDGTTGVVNANKFNRIGTKYNNLHIFDMKTPVWVTFEFTEALHIPLMLKTEAFIITLICIWLLAIRIIPSTASNKRQCLLLLRQCTMQPQSIILQKQHPITPRFPYQTM